MDQPSLRNDLHAADLRATAARMAVLGLVRSARKPLSHGEVSDLLREGPWNRATLYRNLIDLEKAGLVRRTQLGEPVWRFEDADKEHGVRSHPHFLCSACGKMVCLPELDLALRAADGCHTAIRNGNFEIQVRGRCDACSAEKGTA